MCASIPLSVSFFRAFAGIIHMIHLFVHVCMHLESGILFYLYLFRREHLSGLQHMAGTAL